jgi:hypothetical protein
MYVVRLQIKEPRNEWQYLMKNEAIYNPFSLFGSLGEVAATRFNTIEEAAQAFSDYLKWHNEIDSRDIIRVEIYIIPSESE